MISNVVLTHPKWAAIAGLLLTALICAFLVLRTLPGAFERANRYLNVGQITDQHHGKAVVASLSVDSDGVIAMARYCGTGGGQRDPSDLAKIDGQLPTARLSFETPMFLVTRLARSAVIRITAGPLSGKLVIVCDDSFSMLHAGLP